MPPGLKGLSKSFQIDSNWPSAILPTFFLTRWIQEMMTSRNTWQVALGATNLILATITLLVANPFSTKMIFGRKKKKKKKKIGNFIGTLVFMLGRKIHFFFFFFFFCQLIALFHRTMKKKIQKPAKYELFLPKPLKLTFFFMTFGMSCGAERPKKQNSETFNFRN